MGYISLLYQELIQGEQPIRHQLLSRSFLACLLAGALVASGCAAVPATDFPTSTPSLAPAADTPSPVPTQVIEISGTQETTEFTDPDQFASALLQAIMDQDTEKLLEWMTAPFLTGGWRADASDSSPEDALKDLFTNNMGADNQLGIVKDADLNALMGDFDPLTLPRTEAGVIKAVLASGWGKDGRDEAILFIARPSDGSLKWHGWITIQGGFSGERLGGVQLYTNEAYGWRVYIPKGYEVLESNPENVLVMAPGEGHPGEGRAAAFISVEMASGLTVEEIVDKVKTELGPGHNITTGTALGLDKVTAIVVSGLPGQDVNRQLFAVYNDLLYHVTFVPDTSEAGTAYSDMKDLYAQIINTFHFTR